MTKPPSLPEKEWFTLEEVAQRWGTTSKTVLHYGGGGLLQICAYWIYSIKGVYAIGQHSVHREPEEIYHPTGYPPRETLYPLFALTWSELALMEQLGSNESDLAHLCVTRLERDRFEEEHRVGAHAGAMPKTDASGELDPRKERTYLQIIRVMSTELKLPSEPYKAAEMLAAFAARNGVEWPQKPDTVANKLKAARDMED